MATDSMPFHVVSAGPGGVDEMREHVNTSTVQFALLKFVFGSGAFARTKMIFVHINGEGCSAVSRGRLNTKKGAAKEAVGATHAEIIVEAADEVTVDHILEELSKVIKIDDMGDFSIGKMKADYERMLAQTRMRHMSISGGRPRKTAAEMGTVPSHRAIEELRKPIGAFNWCLFKGMTSSGELDFLNAGSMSIHEMRDWLKPDQVVFGLLRMGFGTGRFRRTKYIFVAWSGEEVKPVARGRANAQRADLAKALDPFSVEISPTSLDEITLEVVIDKVRRATVVDGDDAETKDPYSVENFMAALAEEQAANADFFGDSGEGGDSAAFDFRSTCSQVHDFSSSLTYMLFQEAP